MGFGVINSYAQADQTKSQTPDEDGPGHAGRLAIHCIDTVSHCALGFWIAGLLALDVDHKRMCITETQ